MDLIHSLTDLFHVHSHFSLNHRLRFLQLVIQLAPGAHFQDDVDVLGVIKKAIHFDDIGVIKIGLDLELSDELICYFLFN